MANFWSTCRCYSHTYRQVRVHSLGYRCLQGVQCPKFMNNHSRESAGLSWQALFIGPWVPLFPERLMDSWTLWADYRYLCARLHRWLQSAEDHNSTSFIIQFTCNKVRSDHFWFSMIWSLSVFICIYVESLHFVRVFHHNHSSKPSKPHTLSC